MIERERKIGLRILRKIEKIQLVKKLEEFNEFVCRSSNRFSHFVAKENHRTINTPHHILSVLLGFPH